MRGKEELLIEQVASDQASDRASQRSQSEICRSFFLLFASFSANRNIFLLSSSILLPFPPSHPSPTTGMGNLCSRIEVVGDDLYSRVRGTRREGPTGGGQEMQEREGEREGGRERH